MLSPKYIGRRASADCTHCPSRMCDDGDKTLVTEMSWLGGGGVKLNRKLCTSIKTCGEDIKSYTPVLGDRLQEAGTQRKATVPSERRDCSLCRREKSGGETGRPGLIMYLKFVYRNAYVQVSQ